MKVFAPAKINLALHVTGQRADGFHLLDMLVAFASVGDEVEFRDQGPPLTVTGPEAAGVPEDGRNLCLKALEAFAPGRRPALHLTKVLPASSGIGGGSADAAAVLRGLQAISPRADLPALALSLGADVPMCLASLPARTQGIGEVLTPLPGLARMAVVLVNPRVEVSTPAIFKALTVKANPPLPPLPDVADAEDLIQWLQVQRNDLQAPAMALQPVIGQCLAALAPARFAAMSGSGATCFGLFDGLDQAQARAASIAAANPGWWVRAGVLDGQDRAKPRS